MDGNGSANAPIPPSKQTDARSVSSSNLARHHRGVRRARCDVAQEYSNYWANALAPRWWTDP